MRGGWVERGTVLIRLSRPHFAFFRGYLDGLDIGLLARRYLETAEGTEDAASDRRHAQRAVQWIRAQLRAAARRTGNPSAVRLLQIAPEKLNVVYADNIPSLEAFREERDPYEMYGEEELIALFQEEYGSGSSRESRRAERNQRLRSKQLRALWQLETLVGADPALSDGVDGWLDPALAQRLKAAGLTTLGQLVDAIQGVGFRWYMRVPKVGAKAAAHIVRWLTEPSVSTALGVTLHVRGLVRRTELPADVPPISAPCTDIVPLERFRMPPGLDGAVGTNRGERSLLSAHNDLAAIHAWLARCRPGSHTRRSYRKEAERFLLWAILEKGKPISSLSVEDCLDYRDFLWHLGRMTPDEWGKRFRLPQARWLGPRGASRWSPLWRPFEGPLSAGSQQTALVIVQALCQWLTEQHYLHGNPFKSVGKLARREGKIDVTRALTAVEWTAIKEYLATLESDERTRRLRFILVLAYSTGLRLSELAALQKRHLRYFYRAGENTRHWELQVTGKGGVTRAVQLHPAAVDAIREVFLRRGHMSLEAAPDDTPVIAALPATNGEGRADEPLSPSRLYDILKGFFTVLAASLDSSQYEMAERLKRASPHWLRHTFATHALHSGVTLEAVRDLLGHKSLATTSVYVTTERDNRSRALEIFGKGAEV